MKAWLSALVKLLAEFFVLLALLSAATAFAATLDEPRPDALGLAALENSLVEWPLALALALTTGIVSFAGGPARSLRNLLSVTLVGIVIATAGTAARNLDWPPPVGPRSFPVWGQAVENGDRLASVDAIEGRTVRKLVTVDWSKAMPRLSWWRAAPFDPSTSSAVVGSERWSLVPAWEKAESPISSGIPILDGLKPPLSRLGGEDLVASLARAYGFVLLCIGLGTFSLRFRLPISSLLVALVAALIAALLDASALAARLPTMIASLQGGSGIAIGAQWVLPAAEFLLGVVAGSIGLLLARGVKE